MTISRSRKHITNYYGNHGVGQFPNKNEPKTLNCGHQRRNLISWNGGASKYDIRDWTPQHEKMGKGITLSKDEIKELYEILGKILEE